MRAIVAERKQRNALRLAIERAAQERRQRRRKRATLVGFVLGLLIVVFGANAPYSTLREVALRAAQTATIFASLLIVGLVLKTARDLDALVRSVRPKDGGPLPGLRSQREK